MCCMENFTASNTSFINTKQIFFFLLLEVVALSSKINKAEMLAGVFIKQKHGCLWLRKNGVAERESCCATGKIIHLIPCCWAAGVTAGRGFEQTYRSKGKVWQTSNLRGVGRAVGDLSCRQLFSWAQYPELRVCVFPLFYESRIYFTLFPLDDSCFGIFC